MKTKKLVSIGLLLILIQEYFAIAGGLEYHKLMSGILIVLCFSIILFRHEWQKGKTTKIVLCFLLYQLLCCLIHGRVYAPIYVDILETLCWPAVFLVTSYAFTRNFNGDNRKILLTIFVAALFLNIVIYVKDFEMRMYVLHDDDVRSNLIFFIVCLIPFTALIENNKKRYLIYLTIVAFSVLSLKRTAMLVSFAAICVELFLNLDFKKNRGRNIFFSVVFVLLGYIAISQIESLLGLSVLDRFQAIGEDGGSGRDEIYKEVWNHIKQQPFEYLIFGRGHNGVRADGFISLSYSFETLSAHTDFLEVIYDYGIIGTILYVSFIIQIMKIAMFWKSRNLVYYRAMIISIIVFILISATSHLILYATYFTYIVTFWAFMYTEKIKYKALKTT